MKHLLTPWLVLADVIGATTMSIAKHYFGFDIELFDNHMDETVLWWHGLEEDQ